MKGTAEKRSASLTKALEILKDTSFYKCIDSRSFAEQMWPDSKMHTHRTRNGVVGAGAWLCAGSYLAKLRYKGLVMSGERGYYISRNGKEYLKSVGVYGSS